MPDPEKPDIDYKKQLKPAPGWVSGMTKFSSGVTFISGLATAAMGIAFIVTGHKAGKAINNNLNWGWGEKTAKTLGNIGGGAFVASGLIATLFGAAGWRTAKGAEDAKKFAEAAETSIVLNDARVQNAQTLESAQKIQSNLMDLERRLQAQEKTNGR